ncbi:hypothetical protein [Pedobacter alluvionis]|uniref:Uncharacterized protein n=1 Tax=Pedobacter alluvionis TaxID=475253 RepID=A0A497Y9I2_9SPHI|nr:hypothetical protein [Pedobacter alluvionis]RLJ80222.1 hypothetical protein BCL90_0972 [Pedobacter alluvionis]TFB31502.1 hypothetical protein E3V97_12990 [Pedobacter alluvionis]
MDSLALDVIIGAVSVCFFCTVPEIAIQEFVAGLFGLRAKILERGMVRIPGDPSGNRILPNKFHRHRSTTYLLQNDTFLRNTPLYDTMFGQTFIYLFRENERSRFLDQSVVIDERKK